MHNVELTGQAADIDRGSVLSQHKSPSIKERHHSRNYLEASLSCGLYFGVVEARYRMRKVFLNGG